MQHFAMPQGGVQRHQRLFRLLHEDSLAAIIAARVEADAGDVAEMPAFLRDATGKIQSAGPGAGRRLWTGLLRGRAAAKSGGHHEFLGTVGAR